MAKRILVVDDEAHILQILRVKLRNAGFEVLCAADGEEGFDTAVREKPDLIITDFQMPYMTGLELCRALAQEPATRHTPVLMLTARGFALDDDDLKAVNIKEVIAKPFSPRDIVRKINDLLDLAAPDAPSAANASRSEAA